MKNNEKQLQIKDKKQLKERKNIDKRKLVEIIDKISKKKIMKQIKYCLNLKK